MRFWTNDAMFQPHVSPDWDLKIELITFAVIWAAFKFVRTFLSLPLSLLTLYSFWLLGKKSPETKEKRRRVWKFAGIRGTVKRMRGTNAFIRSVTIRSAAPAKGLKFQIPPGTWLKGRRHKVDHWGTVSLRKMLLRLRADSVSAFPFVNESPLHKGESSSNFPRWFSRKLNLESGWFSGGELTF